jgi:hypothetical protein
MKEKVANQGITQVLREDASPMRANCIIQVLRRGSHGFAGLAPHFGRSFRSRSTALCPGRKDFPNQPLGLTALLQPQKYKRINVHCQIDSLKKYIHPIGEPFACGNPTPNPTAFDPFTGQVCPSPTVRLRTLDRHLSSVIDENNSKLRTMRHLHKVQRALVAQFPTRLADPSH